MSRLPTSTYPPTGPGASNGQQQQQRHLQPTSASHSSLRPPSSAALGLAGSTSSITAGGGSGGPAPSVVSGSTHVGGGSSLAGHLELTRQLGGSFDSELDKLSTLAESFYDALDRAVEGAGDPRARNEALKLVQLQLAHVCSLARQGLGAVPVPFPPLSGTATTMTAAEGSAPIDQQPMATAAAGRSGVTLEGLTAGWAADLPALFSQRQAFREAVAVAEGVFKRAS
jgi:hypothetical protein